MIFAIFLEMNSEPIRDRNLNTGCTWISSWKRFKESRSALAALRGMEEKDMVQ